MGYQHISFPEGSVFLVTGGAGFIGSNLCEAILKLGYHVRCLDDLSTGKQTNVDLFKGNANYTFIKGDIKDLDTCIRACEGVSYVLNQAAWGSVPRSIEMPLFYCVNNIMGTLNMMEAARQCGLKKFVYASSSSVYGDEPNLPKREGREGNLLSPYAVSKMCDEEWGKQYTRHYGLDTYGLRYFNIWPPPGSQWCIRGSHSEVYSPASSWRSADDQWGRPPKPRLHIYRERDRSESESLPCASRGGR